MASDVMSTKRVVMKLGDAMWAGGVEGGRPHGTGDLILPNGSVHHGNFEAGRASGPGVFYDATGAVITGSWADNKRVGPFTTIDPKGGEWADVYDADGKRTSRKKRAPPAAEAPGALKCTHCGVKFHAEHNSCCRQHSGKWMQSSEADAGEFPEGGIWLCCGSKSREGGEKCSLGLHATLAGKTAAEAESVQLNRSANGEVVLSSGRRRAAPAVSADAQEEEGWRERVRQCLLREQGVFMDEDGLVVLDTDRYASLGRLASLAECGKTGCACLRTLFPTVRTRFREELVRLACAARAEGVIPADGRIAYAGLGAGRLLGDLDVLCGLQEAGFTITHAAFIDLDYAGGDNQRTDAPTAGGDNQRTDPPTDGAKGETARALAELAAYLAPEGELRAYGSAAEYARARLRAAAPAAHIFVQMDCDEIEVKLTAALSAVALAAEGGLGFRLANRHDKVLVPMTAWRRSAYDPVDDSLATAYEIPVALPEERGLCPPCGAASPVAELLAGTRLTESALSRPEGIAGRSVLGELQPNRKARDAPLPFARHSVSAG